ncbi:MAG: penicillin-binding protein 1A [Candidatus Sedimenticola sp. PURPLELP]
MKWIIKLLKFGFWTALIGTTIGAIAGIALYFHLEPNLPSTENLKHIKFQVPLRVYSADNKLIAEFGEKRRIPLGYDEIPDQMTNAFLAAEDDRFFEHPGVDYQGLLRAAVQLVLTGERRQGGSTITMQVARNFYLSSEKTYTRKLNEILLALQIERELSKKEILELYLNKIYLGHRSYGVGAAAQVYYGKSVEQLDLAQTAMIAGLPKAPSRFNPVTNPERAQQRRDYVLGRMKALGHISDSEYETSRSEPVSAKLHKSETEMEAPYVAEMVRSEMIERFGNEAYTDGYNVHTTIDSRLQASANSAIRMALQAYDLRHGYRGPTEHFDITGEVGDEELDSLLEDQRTVGDLQPAIITNIEKETAEAYIGQGVHVTIPWEGLKWAREHKTENRLGPEPKQAGDILKTGDLVQLLLQEKEDESWWRLAQTPAAAGALISADPNNGAIKALIGGYDFYQSKFNRVTQAKRQPGSGFKAIIYSAALEAGFTPASLINDAPVVFNDPSLEGAWRPENYSGKFFGPTRLRYALTKSRNLVSIRLLRNMGVKFALKHAERFGFNSDQLPHNLSLALGSASVTPLQMATAYSVLANGGYKVEPYFIERIEDSEHSVIFQAQPLTVCEQCTQPAAANAQTSEATPEDEPKIAPRVISPENHYLMNSMMRDVITRGTARKARSLGRKDLAGKTGTTNDQRDAWFNGFNRSLVAIAWVGFDSSKPLGRGEVGGRAALPAWIAFMKDALEGVEEIPLEMPPGMVTVRIDPTTGKRAGINQEDGIFEVFRAENAPKESADSQTGNGGPGDLTPDADPEEGAPDLF